MGTECRMECELGTECPMEQDQFDHDAAHGSMPEDSTNEQIEPGKEVNLYVGMEFESLGDAFKCYSNYAHNKGFSVRRNRITKSRSDKSIIGQEFVCSKEGFRSKKDSKADMPRDKTRQGCKALVYVSQKEKGKWIIARLVLEHNHVLASPYSKKFLRSKRKKSVAQKNLIDMLDQSGVRPSKIVSVLATQVGGIGNLNVTDHDVCNYLSTKRHKELEKGDAQLMLQYFQKRQSENPGFFYAIQVDIEGRLANCFWADAKSRSLYKHFGDVVTFDPTYLTNKYKMPFVPLTGVNHHYQSILFGGALLWDETEESFVWLLQTWLEAMLGCPPKIVITDQDIAITNVVARVLPHSTHHFCMWHIEKKFPETLSHIYHQNNDFKYHFSKCIHDTITPEEFEMAWTELIEKYKLQNNTWIQKVYSIRERWVPAFVRASFCAGMSTTQRSESMNKFFKDYLNSSTAMSKFVTQYDRAIEARYDKEKEKKFKTKNTKPILKTLYPMEAEAAKVYTRKIFRMFQDELLESQKYVSEKITMKDGVYKYRVHERQKEFPSYIVILNIVEQKVECSCHKFEFVGILCKHALMVFIKKQIHSLPMHYLLDRWTMSAICGRDEGDFSEKLHQAEPLRNSSMWFNDIMVRSLGISEKASRSAKHHRVALQGLQALSDKLDDLPYENEQDSSLSISQVD
ncbi:protein FAR1-RELATED SEQUENCE 5-like [Coffea eugenioides]|uniref:protein FAR1-RELATED SEQUENCE 5-like n=1 Tax=Coffea eugenioides TaxID=49369 RepID=UPI000F611556|nr:protein FAR1-RELATED SEQUENCE 5-like [Coffea eugenioides]